MSCCSSHLLRRYGLCGLLIVLYLCAAPRPGQAAAWKEKTSRHFRVFYTADATFAAAVLDYAEYYYDRIALDLGLTHVLRRDQRAWLWEDRCRIYLYADQRTYVQATGAPVWSGGFVRYQQRLIYSFNGAATFLETTLPHELTHIVFREYVGFSNARVPRWLDEGVAQYLETGKVEQAWSAMRAWVAQGVYMPLTTLSRLQVRHATGGTAQVFYTQAATLVDFLLASYGSRGFIDFCSGLRDGYDLERALSFATDGRVRALDELEAIWLAALRQTP